MALPQGKILALDVGDVRIGVAASDAGGFIASPVTIIKRGQTALGQIQELVRQSAAVAVVIGLPLNMDGSVGFQAKKVQNFAKQIEEAIAPVPVVMEDERHSTMDARELRLARGTKKKKRQMHIDAEAAAIFLQAWLDRVRSEKIAIPDCNHDS